MARRNVSLRFATGLAVAPRSAETQSPPAVRQNYDFVSFTMVNRGCQSVGRDAIPQPHGAPKRSATACQHNPSEVP